MQLIELLSKTITIGDLIDYTAELSNYIYDLTNTHEDEKEIKTAELHLTVLAEMISDLMFDTRNFDFGRGGSDFKAVMSLVIAQAETNTTIMQNEQGHEKKKNYGE